MQISYFKKCLFQTTASTFDKRKMPLVFKACLMEMGENLLLDFRLSKVLYFSYNIDQCLSRIHQGPVVQSIVSLTSSLRGQLIKCLTTL